jgi:stearoyl-CoA desaturase (delta-9 desaturase)
LSSSPGRDADPTCARHGVLPGQLDPSARLIRLLEKAGWAYDVRWPKAQRLAALRLPLLTSEGIDRGRQH